METFIWKPVGQPAGETKYRIKKAQFGDGYSQEAPDGINNRSRSWPLQFFGTRAEVEPIIDFLDRHQGASAFQWTAPFGGPGTFKVASFTTTPQGGGTWIVAATFEEHFAP